MKPLVRIAAVFSFGFFLFPGLWVLGRANAQEEALAVVLGCALIGIAFFAGPLLWLAGERCGSKLDTN
jgi:hypothetical protein